MSSRELLQRRKMLPNGDTIWEDGQLVRAAKKGAICVLDGINRGERVQNSALCLKTQTSQCIGVRQKH